MVRNADELYEILKDENTSFQMSEIEKFWSFNSLSNIESRLNNLVAL